MSASVTPIRNEVPWTQASAPIHALVSGYASDVRREKRLAFLQAFIDDSAGETGERRLFMAGYINAASKWTLFADAWAEELRAAPAIDYMRMVEAQNLRGQFRGWSHEARDQKLRGLVRVIRHFRPVSFQFSVPRKDFLEIASPVFPRGPANPYFSCTLATVFGIARFAAQERIDTPIDFIFDEQDGVSDDINLFFGHMKNELPKRARRLINGNPIFRDDKQFSPLQAADMLAWHIRREHEVCKGGDTLPMADLLRHENGHLISEIDTNTIKSMAKEYRSLRPAATHQTKSEWRKIKKVIAEQSSLGFVPPHGTRFKNALYRARERIARFFRT